MENIRYKFKYPQSFLRKNYSYLAEDILKLLKNIRMNFIYEEFQLQNEINRILEENNIEYVKEYKLAARNRIDFFILGGIGIEVKKGKPNKHKVLSQLERYTKFKEINSIILVTEKSIDVPNIINGKKCFVLCLNRLWGVAL